MSNWNDVKDWAASATAGPYDYGLGQRVLALIAENERLAAILALQKSRRAEDDDCLSLATQNIDELRKDAERYQWVVDNAVQACTYLVTDLGQGIYTKSKVWEINRDIDTAINKER